MYATRLEAIPLFASLAPEERELVGEIALLCTGRRTAAIVATSPMTLFSLYDLDFRDIERRVPQLARELRRVAGERLAAARA